MAFQTLPIPNADRIDIQPFGTCNSLVENTPVALSSRLTIQPPATSFPMFFSRKKLEMPTADSALKGRADPIPTAKAHFLNKRALKGPYPDGLETAIFGLGCFWGAERKFWEMGDGIWVTAVGYADTRPLVANDTEEGRTANRRIEIALYPKDLSEIASQLKP